MELELSDVISNGFVERDNDTFCIVHLIGEYNGLLGDHKMIGLISKDREDYEILEEAFMIFTGKLDKPDGVVVVVSKN